MTSHTTLDVPETYRQAGAMAVPQWYVLWTRSHCEQMVFDQLSPKGFQLFFPKIDVWARRNGMRYRASVPMFPGYVFLSHAMEKTSYVEVCRTRGLVKLLGDGWDRLAVVPEQEMDAIQRIDRANLPALPHPYLQEGQQVRITSGLLAGVEGRLVRTKANKGLVVVSVTLLRQSVAVEIDCTMVAPL